MSPGSCSGGGYLQAPSEAGRIHFLPAEGHPQLLSTWVSPAANFTQPANGITEVTPHHFGDNRLIATSHSPTHTTWKRLSKGMNVRMRDHRGPRSLFFLFHWDKIHKTKFPILKCTGRCNSAHPDCCATTAPIRAQDFLIFPNRTASPISSGCPLPPPHLLSLHLTPPRSSCEWGREHLPCWGCLTSPSTVGSARCHTPVSLFLRPSNVHCM